MERICFVIMPFSKTESCNDKEWTSIFNTLFKKTIEGLELGYGCRRSSATRGNIIKDIIADLESSHVVLADLTDQNPNVFYELGIRHALRPRTILIAQNRDHIPFDLKGYANYIYDWKTPLGRKTFKKKMRELLNEIDENSERSDNPVSDFLGRTSISQTKSHTISTSNAIPIIGPRAAKLNISDLVSKIVEDNKQ